MLAKLFSFLFLLLLLYPLDSLALESRIPTENIFSSEIIYYPSGPATRNEWRSSSDGKIIQLEIKKAKSGQILIEKLKLKYQNKVGWRIENLDGSFKLKINPKSINSGKPINLKINTQVWAITLSNEEMSKVIPGIAAEAELRIDIFMKLIK